jgi:hypothetical protein
MDPQTPPKGLLWPYKNENAKYCRLRIYCQAKVNFALVLNLNQYSTDCFLITGFLITRIQDCFVILILKYRTWVSFSAFESEVKIN